MLVGLALVVVGAVIVPRRTNFELAAIGRFFLVQKCASSVTVIIDAEFVDDQEINKAGDLDELPISRIRVSEIGPIQHIFKRVDHSVNVISLHRQDGRCIGIDKLELHWIVACEVVDGSIIHHS